MVDAHKNWCTSSRHIPATPNRTYADQGWRGYGDWLGTGRVAYHLRECRPFEEARAYARSLGLKTAKEWLAHTKTGALPADIRANPKQMYVDKGWQGYGDWLGTGRVADRLREYRPFEEARAYARSLGLKSFNAWLTHTRTGALPADIPATPNQTYADQGWRGYGDWLGTGRVANYLREHRPFKEARTHARSLGLKTAKEWWAHTKTGALPADIPACPNQTYADQGWQGYGDWLGTGRVADQLREYRPFEEGRAYACSLSLKTVKAWLAHTKAGALPGDIPANPDQTYADQGWRGYGDWLGTGNIKNGLRNWRPFDEARAYASSLGLKSQKDWWAYAKSGALRADIPKAPHHCYAFKGWQGYDDWLGTGKIASFLRKYRSFEDARTYARSLGLPSESAWRTLCKSGALPADIPSKPDKTYADKGWQWWGDWLGTGRKPRSRPSDRLSSVASGRSTRAVKQELL